MRSGETTGNESWSIAGITNFYAEVNTLQGVVDKISWLITYNLTLGSATDLFVYEVVIENLNPGVTKKAGFELYFGLTLSILGVIVIKVRKRIE